MDCVSLCPAGGVVSVDKPPYESISPPRLQYLLQATTAGIRDVTAVPFFGNAPRLLPHPGGSREHAPTHDIAHMETHGHAASMRLPLDVGLYSGSTLSLPPLPSETSQKV